MGPIKSNVSFAVFSNLQGVGGDSEISPAICPTGFVKFIDVCIQDSDPAPTDFDGKYIILLNIKTIFNVEQFRR